MNGWRIQISIASNNVLAADASSPYHLAIDVASIEDIDDLLSLSLSQPGSTWLNLAQPGSTWLNLAQANTLISLIKWYGAQGTTEAAVFIDLDKFGLSAFRRERASTAPTTSAYGPVISATPSKPILSLFPFLPTLIYPLLMNSSRESKRMPLPFQPSWT